MHAAISNVFVATLALGIANAFPTPMGNSPNDNTDLIAELITAPTQIKRYQKLLTDESGNKLLEGDKLLNATTWDFNQNGFVVPGGQGGLASSASLETFPYLINSGMSLTMGGLGPCGLFLPHIHPRANEFFFVTEGEVDFGVQHETGLFKNLGPNPEITGKLTNNMATVFPKGSVHFQVNNSPDCTPTTTYAVLSSEDPGINPIVMEPVPGNVTVGERKRVDAGDFETVRAVTPPHIAKIVDECLARCHRS